MAPPLLTLKQFAMLALGQAAPPWRCSSLLTTYNQKFLPLRSSITNLSSTPVLIYLAIRSTEDVAAQVGSVNNSTSRVTLLTENQAPDGVAQEFSLWDLLWSGAHPVKKTDLDTLQSLLSPIGASIVYLNPYIQLRGFDFIPPWATVGIAGTFGGLASLKLQELPFNPSLWTDAEWASLAALKEGTVMIMAGGDYTSSATWTIGGTTRQAIAGDAVPGPYPAKMFILGGM